MLADRHRRRAGARGSRPAGAADLQRRLIGEAGLTTARHEAGYMLTDTDAGYVVVGETRTYSFEAITPAIRLIESGARFIATIADASTLI